VGAELFCAAGQTPRQTG